MSTSRIIDDGRFEGARASAMEFSLALPCPGAAQDPVRSARVVAQLVGVTGGAFHREIPEHRLALAPGPSPRDLPDSHHASSPAKPERLELPFRVCREHVDGIVEGFEHVVLAPGGTLLHMRALAKQNYLCDI